MNNIRNTKTFRVILSILVALIIWLYVENIDPSIIPLQVRDIPDLQGNNRGVDILHVQPDDQRHEDGEDDAERLGISYIIHTSPSSVSPSP